jgi:hypothetical protein
MEVDAEMMQTYPCFHCIEKDKRIAELQAETKMANLRINELKADLAKAKLSNAGMHKTIERLTDTGEAK